MNFSLLLESGSFLMNFAAQRDYYTLKRKQIMIAREVENTERHIYRKEENEKYNIVLANRRREDELRRTKHEAENNELKDIEKMIEDKKLVSYQKNAVYRADEQGQMLYQHFKRPRGSLLPGNTRQSVNVLLNTLENNQRIPSTTSSSSCLDTTNIKFYRSSNKERPEQEHSEQEQLKQEYSEQEYLKQEHSE
jgi:hypothetical protein